MNPFVKSTSLFLLFLQSVFYINAQTFELNTSFPEVNGDSRSANWVDLNMDGHLDIFFTDGPSSGENNQAYLGFGNGNFVPYDASSPLLLDNSPSVGACIAEANIFSGLDIFVTTWYGERNIFYTWTGQNYEQVEVAPPSDELTYSETGAFGDANQNGLLDLYVTNSAGSNNRNHFYNSTLLGAFIKETEGVIVEDEGASRGVTWIDYDNDGDADLFVTNEDDTPNRLYQNQGDGSFISIQDGVLATDAGATMSATWGDYNNDGYMDVFISNYNSDNRLYTNGPEGFVEESESIVSNDGGYSFSANWGDIDNDGDLDLFVSNAFAANSNQSLNNFLYRNDGEGGFTKIETDVVTQNDGWTYGNAFGDFDQDGDLDLLTANCFQAAEPNRLYNNLTSSGENAPGWLEVNCVGTFSNTSAIGARVTILAEIDGEEVWQTREITSQSSYCGQNMLTAHFGLGDADAVDLLVIDWPNSPNEVYTDININQHFVAVEGTGTVSVGDIPEKIAAVIYPNPTSDYIKIALDGATANPIKLTLFDTSGKEVLHLPEIGPGNTSVHYDLPQLPKGTYVVRGEGAQGIFTRKVQIINP